jgi:hypothetical protein
VHVTLRSPDGARDYGELPALVDTAADRSVIPERAVGPLGLVRVDEIHIMGMGGNVAPYPSFIVQLQLRQQAPVLVEVVASPEEPLVLLGRDFLNRYRIDLNGPGLALEIT